MRLCLTMTILICVAVLPDSAAASARQASRCVRQGISKYRTGDFEAAGKAFSDADVALPENGRVAFNRACVHMAQGDTGKAIELFQQAALSRDSQLAKRCHYNLGCLQAAKAKSLFGDKPEEATPEVREQGMQLLSHAVNHYRDCLEIDANHSGARHNLEVLRLWIKHMREVWAKRDREKQRKEMNLLQFLKMIQAQQRTLRQTSKLLERQSDSPRRRQVIGEVEAAQETLAHEIKPLKEKIAEAFQPPPTSAANAGQPQPPPAANDKAKQATKILTKLADESRKFMLQARDHLNDIAVVDAVGAQTNVLDQLNDILMAVAPFIELLQTATNTEQQLVDQSEAIKATKSENTKAEKANAGDGKPFVGPGHDDSGQPEFAELAREQSSVTQISEVLPLKARQELQQLEASAAASPNPSPSPTPNPPTTPPTDPQQEAQHKEQIAGLKASLQKAIELSPQIQDASKQAAEALEKEQADRALPQQKQALELLKEIAKSLPKQDQQKQDQQSDKDQPQKQDQQQQKQQSADKNRQKNDPQQNLSRRQAESVLRKVQEREREHRDLKKQYRRFLGGPVKVDKDW